MTIYGGSIYFICNQSNTTLYIGVTADLVNRLIEHKTKKILNSFSARYNCDKLVYFEHFYRIEEAIEREKQIKNWHRAWKNKLIEELNPNWEDISNQLYN